jgi:glucose/arabinose dehydrogenase
MRPTRSLLVALLLAASLIAVADPLRAAAVPTGFADVVAFRGLVQPTAVRFAPDGRIFVAEERGTIVMFDGLGDTTPVRVADLRTEVYNHWDRGLLGLAVDPQFPRRPYLYVLYTYDAAIGGKAPRWGKPGLDSDPCPDPPGDTRTGCGVSGKLARLTLTGTTTVKKDLINDWCQQYPSHSVGDLAFGRDGALYASAGDGASFTFTDYGQAGSPRNPCGDPPGGVGGAMTPPTAQGGALRAQDLRTAGDPVGLDGTVIQVSPDTGAAMSTNPDIRAADPNARRIVAYGLRNPFRMAARPGTDEVWLGDVGWNAVEEINRIPAPTAAVTNFGWPCFEGPGRQPGYAAANLSICANLYEKGGDTKPFFAYRHGTPLTPSDSCSPSGGSSITGVRFYPGGPYPPQYDGALFFSDYSRRCIWVMPKGPGGLPDPGQVRPFVATAATPVDVELSPQGELFYADDDGGTIHRIVHTGAAPGAQLMPVANRGDALVAPESPAGAPVPTITAPAEGTTWQVGQTISFAGSATDPHDGVLPASALHWEMDLRHCPSGCHTHVLQTWDGVASGSIAAPDHDYPSHLELRLTATDSGGRSATVARPLYPRTVRLTLASQPAGLQIVLGSGTVVTPFTATVIVGSTSSVSATSPQSLAGATYRFMRWSDGEAQSHDITVGTTDSTITAVYADPVGGPRARR